MNAPRLPRRPGRRHSRPAAVYRWLCAGHEPDRRQCPAPAIFFAAALFSLFGLLFMWLCYAGVKTLYVEVKLSTNAQSPVVIAVFRAIAVRCLFCIANLCTLGAFNVKLAIPGFGTQYVLNDPILLSGWTASMGCIFIGVFYTIARRSGGVWQKKVYIGGAVNIWVAGDLLNCASLAAARSVLCRLLSCTRRSSVPPSSTA